MGTGPQENDALPIPCGLCSEHESISFLVISDDLYGTVHVFGLLIYQLRESTRQSHNNTRIQVSDERASVLLVLIDWSRLLSTPA